jgi:hypothetical protein
MTRQSTIKALLALSALLVTGAARAGVPFINLEGAGGVAFNPLAYTANDAEEGVKVEFLEIAKPRVGGWYVNLGQSAIDWTTIGVATTFNKRLEVSYGYEATAIGGFLGIHETAHKNNLGGKLLLLPENSFGTSFLPGISVGAVWKTTDYHPLPNSGASGVDAYVVATKMVTQIGFPLLLSVGGLSTQGQVTGIIGFNSQRALVVFANIDVVPLSWLAVGTEYRMGPNYGAAGGGYVDANYLNVHAGWFVTKGVTVIAAYTYAGGKTDANSSAGTAVNPIGFGNGFVFAGQYSF